MLKTQERAKKKLDKILAEGGKYKQNLFKIVKPIDKKVINKINKKTVWVKKINGKDVIGRKSAEHTERIGGWEYGYNEEHDIVVISKTGQIGDIYEIQGLRIAIPPTPDKIHSRSKTKTEQYWEKIDVPEFINKIKTIYQFNNENSEAVKLKWSPYIYEEFNRRDNGFWFSNNGEPTYITGSHYMYLQWTKTDAEIVEYRKSNQLFYYFWEACKADNRCYGMCYLKNRRSGFSFMASAETVNLATITSDSRYGMLSKTGEDAKKMFVDKVVPIANNYPFFFKPLQSGMDKPKTELSFRKPPKKLTDKTIKSLSVDDGLGKGLETTIDHKTTGDYSYDGEKLKLLVHDESGKWAKPANIQKNWRVTKTCLRLGRRIVGKCMMGSTAGALDSGGEEFKDIYWKSDLRTVKRNANGQTSTGLYSLFVPMEWNFEGYIDKYGYPVFEDPKEPLRDIWGETIAKGVLTHWKGEVDGLQDSPDSLNAYYRQFPKTENHAFRDESEGSMFNLVRINDQLDYNDEMIRDNVVTRGNFGWQDGIMDSEVIWHPNPNGKFFLTKVLPSHLQNNIVVKNGIKCPGNDHLGSFGCDPYDISGTAYGVGSNGALHGLSKSHLEDFPTNHFFLEYISRPATAELFYEDVLMAIVFYGMPILVENNKIGLLKYIARRGYRGFSINRPDRKFSKLSPSERELGGLPMTGEQVIHDHANAINSYIEKYVGKVDDGMGQMYFNRTLMDWSKFTFKERTIHDASVSSGLAIMANQRLLYRPKVKRDRETVMELNIGQRDNYGRLIYNKYGNTPRTT